MYKIAVLGDRDSIFGFATLGLDIFPVEDSKEATETLRRLANGSYAVIYITEAVLSEIESEVARYTSELIPAIIPIPGVSGNTGIGIYNVRNSVERAVGSDIIFNNDN